MPHFSGEHGQLKYAMEALLERMGKSISLVTLAGPPAILVMADDLSADAWRMDDGKDVHDEAVLTKGKEIMEDAKIEWVQMDGYRAALPRGWEEQEWIVDRGAIWITWNGKRWRVSDLHMGINVVDPKSIEYAKRLIADPFTLWVQKAGGNYFKDSVSQ